MSFFLNTQLKMSFYFSRFLQQLQLNFIAKHLDFLRIPPTPLLCPAGNYLNLNIPKTSHFNLNLNLSSIKFSLTNMLLEKNIIHSPFRPVVPSKPPKSLIDLLLQKSQEHSQNGLTHWMTDPISGESFTFSSFDDLTRRIGSALYKRGLRPNDIVIFMEIDIIKQPLLLGGIWRANGIGRSSYPEDDEATLLSRVEESRTGWIYCEPSHVPMCLRVAKKVYWDVEVITTSKDPIPGCISIYDLMSDDGSQLPELESTLEDTALIMCTSGTTGKSKGAVITHKALVWQSYTGAIGNPLFSDDTKTNLVFTKSTHISGTLTPFQSLVGGIGSLYLTCVSKEKLFQVVGKYKPSFIFGFPTLLLMLVNDPEASAKLDLSNLERIASGGAPVTPAIVHALMTLPNLKWVLNMYGLTECCPIVTSTDFDRGAPMEDCPEGTMGKLAPEISAKFMDVETGQAVGPGEIGEMCVKCEGMFKEYHLNPEATKEAFDGDFFKTGDVGYYDENGYIFLVDRAKEIFKYFNNHISPTEIENIILDHPSIVEVCVVGVSDPNGGGQIPRAFCIPSQNSDVTTSEILEYTNGKLAEYKHLRGGVYFLSDLPKGKTGKVARQLVEKIEVDSDDKL